MNTSFTRTTEDLENDRSTTPKITCKEATSNTQTTPSSKASEGMFPNAIQTDKIAFWSNITRLGGFMAQPLALQYGNYASDSG